MTRVRDLWGSKNYGEKYYVVTNVLTVAILNSTVLVYQLS